MGKVLCAEVVPRRLNIVYLRCVPMVGGGLQDTPQTGVKPEASAFFHLNHIVPGIFAGLRTVEGNHCEVQQIMEDPGS